MAQTVIDFEGFAAGTVIDDELDTRKNLAAFLDL